VLNLAVLVPAFNAERTVLAAVRSTLLTLPDRSRVFVLNDGSTDRTAERLRSIRDSRLTVITSTSNRGVAGGLNALIEASDSTYVARMDADDICLPGRFQMQLRHQKRDESVCFTSVIHYSESPVWIRPMLPIALTARQVMLGMLVENVVAHSTMLAPRRLLTAAGPYRDGPAEDYDLWLRLISAGVPMRRLARPGILYRRHPGQVTAAESWDEDVLRDTSLSESYWSAAREVLGPDLTRSRTRRLVLQHVIDRAQGTGIHGFAAGRRIGRKASAAARVIDENDD
jgi:glycosyltransferase involved in cell wall biosynthesis